MKNLNTKKMKNVKIEMGVSIPVLVTEDEMFNHFKAIFDGMLNDGLMTKERYDKHMAILIEETIGELSK